MHCPDCAKWEAELERVRADYDALQKAHAGKHESLLDEMEANAKLQAATDAANAQIAELRVELELIREAAADQDLTDFAVRAIAAGTVKPTAKDIEWAQKAIRRADLLDPPQKTESK